MIRASALYISLIISILIVLVCGSLMLVGYTYKMQERKHMRKDKLRSHLKSATEILLLDEFSADTAFKISLFDRADDSIQLEKFSWGIYKAAAVKAWIGRDMLQKAFLLGRRPVDTLNVFYLADEDRPISISGKSLIKGTAYLPKSGIKAAYVESSGYAEKTLVYGAIKDSQRDLPALNADMPTSLRKLQDLSDVAPGAGVDRVLPDSVKASFFEPVQRIHLSPGSVSLSGLKATGKLVISSDSMLVVAADSRLDKVILVAPYIRIEDGFEGNLQAIASDSIYAGNAVKLRYPSALIVLKNDTAQFQARLTVGSDAIIEGVLIAYEAERTMLMPLLQIGRGTLVKGEVWSKGYVALSKSSEVYGSVTAIRLMAKVASAIYENYLIDVKLDRTRLSRYYLTPELFAQSKQTKLLCQVN